MRQEKRGRGDNANEMLWMSGRVEEFVRRGGVGTDLEGGAEQVPAR